jgi:hypothetical protein
LQGEKQNCKKNGRFKNPNPAKKSDLSLVGLCDRMHCCHEYGSDSEAVLRELVELRQSLAELNAR